MEEAKFFPVLLSCRVRHAPDRALEFNTTSVGVVSPHLVTTTANDGTSARFPLDVCFDADMSNDDVYSTLEPTLVGHVLGGYSACYLCCGHTNTGKTHTVFGSSPEDPGLALRAMEAFANEPDHSVAISFFEIYNENAYDLFCPNPEAATRRVRSNGTVENLTEVRGGYAAAVADGLQRRARGGTWRNSQSSRSHAVFLLTVTCISSLTVGQCCFVDLAGSEKTDPVLESLMKPDALRTQEAISINRSLSELSSVLASIHRRDGYVNYRNSLLTLALRDVLQTSRIVFNVCLTDRATYSSSTHVLKYAANIVKGIATVGRRRRSTALVVEGGSSLYTDPAAAGTSLVAGTREDPDVSRRVKEEFDHYVELSTNAFEAQRRRIASLEGMVSVLEESRDINMTQSLSATDIMDLPETGGGTGDLLSLAGPEPCVSSCSVGVTAHIVLRDAAVGTGEDTSSAHVVTTPRRAQPPTPARPAAAPLCAPPLTSTPQAVRNVFSSRPTQTDSSPSPEVAETLPAPASCAGCCQIM